MHVTDTLPLLEQAQPVPVALTNVMPAGSVSVTDTAVASDGPLSTTTSEYATEPPATTVAGPVLVIARSADGVTVVDADEELLPGTGSLVADVTVAVSVRVAPCAGAVTTTVIVGAEVPVASVARVQVTETFPLFEQAHPVPVADTNVTPAGSVSVTDSDAASDGPLSVTTSWYVTDAPATTVAGPVLVIARSADGVTVVVAEEELLPGTGSLVVAATVAVSVSVAPCAGAVTTTVMVGAVTPVASEGRVQVAETLPAFEQVQPAPVALHEGHPGRQGVGHRQARRVRGTVVDDDQAVADQRIRRRPSPGRSS